MVICFLPFCMCCPTPTDPERLPENLRQIPLTIEENVGYGALLRRGGIVVEQEGGPHVRKSCICLCWLKRFYYIRASPFVGGSPLAVDLEVVEDKILRQISADFRKFEGVLERSAIETINPSGKIYFIRFSGSRSSCKDRAESETCFSTDWGRVADQVKMTGFFNMRWRDACIGQCFIVRRDGGRSSGDRDDGPQRVSFASSTRPDLVVGVLGDRIPSAYWHNQIGLVDRAKHPDRILYFKDLRKRWEAVFPQHMGAVEDGTVIDMEGMGDIDNYVGVTTVGTPVYAHHNKNHSMLHPGIVETSAPVLGQDQHQMSAGVSRFSAARSS